jgi:hypothetical protein
MKSLNRYWIEDLDLPYCYKFVNASFRKLLFQTFFNFFNKQLAKNFITVNAVTSHHSSFILPKVREKRNFMFTNLLIKIVFNVLSKYPTFIWANVCWDHTTLGKIQWIQFSFYLCLLCFLFYVFFVCICVYNCNLYHWICPVWIGSSRSDTILFIFEYLNALSTT